MRSVILLCFLAAGCSSDSTAPAKGITVDGQWNATLVGSFTPGGSGVMSLTLAQKGTAVAGTGTFTDPTDPPAAIMTVSGSVVASTVALTLQVQPQVINGRIVDPNKAPMQFAGTLTASTMNGTLNGGGPPSVAGVAVTFTRQ